jgi:ribosomal protein S18 acetylase RimI-like enzyme
LGVRVLVVDAKDTPAALFYQRYGFTQTLENALTLCLPLGQA